MSIFQFLIALLRTEVVLFFQSCVFGLIYLSVTEFLNICYFLWRGGEGLILKDGRYVMSISAQSHFCQFLFFSLNYTNTLMIHDQSV